MWPPAAGRVGHKPSRPQVRQRIGKTIHWSEARDAFAAHRHDDFAAVGDMSNVAAEVVVKLTHAHLVLEISLWRHRGKYKHHKRAGPRNSVALSAVEVRCFAFKDVERPQFARRSDRTVLSMLRVTSGEVRA
jgi:hypothetical protein